MLEKWGTQFGDSGETPGFSKSISDFSCAWVPMLLAHAANRQPQQRLTVRRYNLPALVPSLSLSLCLIPLLRSPYVCEAGRECKRPLVGTLDHCRWTPASKHPLLLCLPQAVGGTFYRDLGRVPSVAQLQLPSMVTIPVTELALPPAPLPACCSLLPSGEVFGQFLQRSYLHSTCLLSLLSGRPQAKTKDTRAQAQAKK